MPEDAPPANASPGTARPSRSTLAKLAVTAALLALLAWRLDVRLVAQRMGRLDAAWTAAAFGVVLAAVWISAWKWGLILAFRNRPLPFQRLLRHYFVGLFFNNVLPTAVGGDAVRAWETTRDTGEVPEAVGSVLTERLVAGAALGVTALLGLPFADPAPRVVWLVVGFLALDLALVLAFLAPRVARKVAASLLPRALAGPGGAVAATIDAVQASLRAPRLFARVFGLSVVFQALVAAVNACLFEAIGTPVPLAQCIVQTPMIFTVAMLPVSLSGFGVREAAYAYFFGQAGVAAADAVAVSLLFFAVVAVASLPGAALFVAGRRR